MTRPSFRFSRFRPLPLFAALAAFLLCVPAARADQVEFFHRDRFEGLFMAYEKGHFQFQSPDGVMGTISPRNIRRIVLQEPVSVYLELNGMRQSHEVVFLGYEGGQIRFETEGREHEVLLRRVKSIQVGFRTARVMQAADVSRLISSGEEVDITAHLEKGHPSIVHFHDRRFSHSVRMSDYLSRFVVMSKGRIQYLKIECAGPSVPVARQHDIRAFPTIWFYDAEGREVRRLKGGISTREVDEAIAQADGTGKRNGP